MPAQPLPQLRSFQAPDIIGGLASVEGIKASRTMQELNRMKLKQTPELFQMKKDLQAAQLKTQTAQQEKFRTDTAAAKTKADRGYIQGQMANVLNLLKMKQPDMAKKIFNDLADTVPGLDKVDKLESAGEGKWKALTKAGAYIINDVTGEIKPTDVKEKKKGWGEPITAGTDDESGLAEGTVYQKKADGSIKVIEKPGKAGRTRQLDLIIQSVGIDPTKTEFTDDEAEKILKKIAEQREDQIDMLLQFLGSRAVPGVKTYETGELK